jgi:hypothetical protein
MPPPAGREDDLGWYCEPCGRAWVLCGAVGPTTGARCSLLAGHRPESHVHYGPGDHITALWMVGP